MHKMVTNNVKQRDKADFMMCQALVEWMQYADFQACLADFVGDPPFF